jgi:Fe-Mn family superoxide dismutase
MRMTCGMGVQKNLLEGSEGTAVGRNPLCHKAPPTPPAPIQKERKMFSLPDLPYAYDALAPILSADTLHVHHDKHHAAYVKKTNALAEAAGLAGRTLEQVIAEAAKIEQKGLFNNAAQAWNHAFFWRSMTAEQPTLSGALKDAVGEAFGGLPAFQEAFVKAGVDHFGSGWVWLVAAEDGVKIISTHDADNPLTRSGLTPLIVCDVWEHAYYLDHKNDREGFLKRWVAELVDWSFAEKQFVAAKDAGSAYAYPAPMAS